MHRDSLGNIQAIRPGEVNWMTAGNGIAHSERAGDAQGQSAFLLVTEGEIPFVIVEFGIPMKKDAFLDVLEVIPGSLNADGICSVFSEVTVA